MMVIVNPGTEPVQSATADNARRNIPYLIQDAGLELEAVIVHRTPELDECGRYGFELRLDDKMCDVEMPGIPLDQVRYIGSPDQDIRHFPRLYVGGGSWVWKFAMSCLHDMLTQDCDDD